MQANLFALNIHWQITTDICFLVQIRFVHKSQLSAARSSAVRGCPLSLADILHLVFFYIEVSIIICVILKVDRLGLCIKYTIISIVDHGSYGQRKSGKVREKSEDHEKLGKINVPRCKVNNDAEKIWNCFTQSAYNSSEFFSARFSRNYLYLHF